tara:strand:- start:412 stop:771 length:360 start_codon:yes stop_codon:yes gene_type:complete
MGNTILLFISIVIIFFLTALTLKRKKTKQTLIQRFRKKFKGYRQREKARSMICNDLMKDPEKNITIGEWDSEKELREKADVHRARLNKYGKSKMNNEMLYLGPKGGIYRLSSNGNKTYI